MASVIGETLKRGVKEGAESFGHGLRAGGDAVTGGFSGSDESFCGVRRFGEGRGFGGEEEIYGGGGERATLEINFSGGGEERQTGSEGARGDAMESGVGKWRRSVRFWCDEADRYEK